MRWHIVSIVNPDVVPFLIEKTMSHVALRPVEETSKPLTTRRNTLYRAELSPPPDNVFIFSRSPEPVPLRIYKQARLSKCFH